MRFILAILFIQFIVVSVMAERILVRKKYNLIILSDTVYAGEDYFLTVDLKGNKHAEVLRNYSPVPVSEGKGYIKFRAAATSYDKNGCSIQKVNLGVVFSKDTLFEDVTFFVVKPPIINIRPVQDSLTALLDKQEPYNQMQHVTSYNDYLSGFAYDLGTNVLKEETGQLLILVAVDSKGKVIRYDILKNTYKTIPLQNIESAIQSYQLIRKIKYDGDLKFSAVIYTMKGHTGNYIISSEH
jgi:hypothetical protein